MNSLTFSGCNMDEAAKFLTRCDDVYESCKGAHAIAVLTEWDMFKTLDYEKIYKSMEKPAFLFDGRNIIDHAAVSKIGFEVFALGKHNNDSF